MSIAGGLQSECGDLPIFITNVILDGPVGRTKKVKVRNTSIFRIHGNIHTVVGTKIALTIT